MQIIDTKGMLCPAPLIATKKALIGAVEGAEFQLQTNNETVKDNVINYLSELKIKTTFNRKDGIYSIFFIAPKSVDENIETDNYCIPNIKEAYVVAIKSRFMGIGDDALGEILMRAFVNSLCDADKLPTHIVLYNSGVNLAIMGSDTANSMAQLEKSGVSIVVCGTCADYFNLKDKIGIGVISNMYKITKILSETGHVVYP